MTRFRNPLALAHNHGPARGGVAHWWGQRFSSLLLVILTAWLLWALNSLVGADHATASAWLARPWNAAMGVLFVVAMFYHARLGLQVIIEDYVKRRVLEVGLQISIKILTLLGGVLGVVAILSIVAGMQGSS